jgi:excisionase family DNA binding protein
MWHLVHTDQIESFKIGASRRIPREALLAYLESLRGAE